MIEENKYHFILALKLTPFLSGYILERMNTQQQIEFGGQFQASLIKSTYEKRVSAQIEVPEGCKEVLRGNLDNIAGLKCPQAVNCPFQARCTYKRDAK